MFSVLEPRNCPEIISGTSNDQCPLAEYEMACFLHAATDMRVDPTCKPKYFNMSGLERQWKVLQLPLKESSE